MPILLAAPNVSVGPDREALATLADAFGSAASVLDRHSDRIHQRSVFTLAAEPGALTESLVAGSGAAIELIDLGAHAGAHPRIGAIDVCPVVYNEPGQREAAEIEARELGGRLAELGLPVFLYGDLARDPERRERHYFRRGGVEALAQRMAEGDLTPDLGPATPHPSAGAVLVTARPPLAAFNVEVEGIGLDRGREIAATLRESGGGMRGVRAIAIELASGRLQISTNIHDPVGTPLGDVVAEVHRLAIPAGGRAVAAEVVGLVPEAALADYPWEVPIRAFDRSRRTIESRLRELG